ncbi:putative sporulation protein YtxC [Dehalobacter sp. DCM]|uniref:putative sporulation protein YtxC n=1 Tax=Dehalobacter sp. DCM TaxID=2907827 RepID=UPI0030821C30|nr:putative sporulation protein YtxC [Dehalobacter sp. DCM]
MSQKINDLRNNDRLPIAIQEISGDRYLCLLCTYNNLNEKQSKTLTIRIYNYYLARALAETVLQDWEVVFTKKALKRDFNMSDDEISRIYPRIQHYLNNAEHVYLPELRKRLLIKSLLEFFDSHRKIDLDGFMDFRAEKYKRELKKQIARGVNACTLEQEHDGFIQLLKRFYQAKPMDNRILHMVMNQLEGVHFYDAAMKNIDKEYTCLSENIIRNYESYEDLLIGILVKYAPGKLIIHTDTQRPKEMLMILGDVFGERLTYCPGCSLCKEELIDNKPKQV